MLQVEKGESADSFVVCGRGALHISILMENMRREGYEFAVGPPKVITKLSPQVPAGHGVGKLVTLLRAPRHCAGH